MANDNVKSFLDKIATLESSGGKNTNHRTMESGIHAGDTAVGTYGLMPNTIDEVLARVKSSKESSPELEAMQKMSREERQEYIKRNPEAEYKVAEQLANHVLNKQGGDQDKAAYSWLYGHNLSPEKIEERNYSQDPYVQKMQKLRETAGSSGPSAEEQLKLSNYINGLGNNNEMLSKIANQHNKEMSETISGKFRDSGRSSDNLGESIDSVLGVPARTGIAEMQKGNFDLDMLKKVASSIGTDPKNAPTGFDIASATGVENPALGAALATAVDVGATIPGLGAMAKSGKLPGVVGEVGKVSPAMEKFLSMRKTLGREGGYAQRLGNGKTASELSREAGAITQGTTGAGTLTEAAIKQQMANKLRGLK